MELLFGARFRVGITLGGSAGLSLGWNSGGGGLSAASDLKAYAEGQADMTKSIRLFVRGQLDAVREPGRGRILSTPTFLAGTTLMF